MKHNDNCFPKTLCSKIFQDKKEKENTFKCERRGLVIKEEEKEVLRRKK